MFYDEHNEENTEKIENNNMGKTRLFSEILQILPDFWQQRNKKKENVASCTVFTE